MPLTLVNASLDGRASSLRVARGRIAGVDVAPARHDRVLDLRGDRLLPGLINAHDHLQLNALPPPTAARFANVSEWIEAINRRRRHDPEFEAAIAIPRAARLLIGGIKNLLSGVTTVGHHDPFYPGLGSADFPLQVPDAYGWSHSLGIDGEAAVRTACARTPASRPWIIHAAEGIDAAAATEFERLDAMGCVRANTVLVHGVALTAAERSRLLHAGGSLVWCPASNLALFGATARVEDMLASGRLALGSDSRLSGSRDLLAELRLAAALTGAAECTLLRSVTRDAARVLRLPDRGVLDVGMRADLLVVPAGEDLRATDRSRLRMVMVGGAFRYGDADFAAALLPRRERCAVGVDGTPKIIAAHIAAQLAAVGRSNGLHETGVDLVAQARRVA